MKNTFLNKIFFLVVHLTSFEGAGLLSEINKVQMNPGAFIIFSCSLIMPRTVALGFFFKIFPGAICVVQKSGVNI